MEATEEGVGTGGAESVDRPDHDRRDRGPNRAGLVRPRRAAVDSGALSVLVGSLTRSSCEACVEDVPVDGAAIAVSGGLSSNELLHATNAVAARLDDLQFVMGEGPCRDAFRLRYPVLEADLGRASEVVRWPGFAREARAAGAMAVFAFPLQIGAVPFGVLEMYRVAAGPLTESQFGTALTLADNAARAVLADLDGLDLEPTGDHPEPMFGRPEIPQATGMIAVQRRISIAHALAELRAAAFAQDRPVIDVARDVLAGRLVF